MRQPGQYATGAMVTDRLCLARQGQNSHLTLLRRVAWFGKAMESRLTSRQYLGVVLPFMLSTMTQPLMGAVNTAVMGQLTDPAYISGVALGAVLFNTIYWIFGFLRVGTSGYAAQALGSGLAEDKWNSFGRPLLVSLVISGLILAFQNQILSSYLNLVKPEANVAEFTTSYYRLLIWGAPLVLFNYVALGWLMGQARIKATLFMQISANVLNIILSIVLVLYFKYDVVGVAAATLISQVYGAAVGIWLMKLYGGFSLKNASFKLLLRLKPMTDMLTTNGNLVLRTIGLMIVTNLFTASSTSFGTTVLAANSVLLQVIGIMAFLIDGMANGNSLFTGRAVGRKNQVLFEDVKVMSLKWLLVVIIILVTTYWTASGFILGLFSANTEVVAIAGQYNRYVLLYPLCAGLSLTFYGLYTGATQTGPIRDMMFIAMTTFIVGRYFLVPFMGNHGLWICYLIFYGSQSVVLLLFFSRLRRRTGFLKVARQGIS